MLFNSFEFIAYISVLSIVFYILNRAEYIRLRNAILLLASWIFYGFFKLWFLGLLFFIIIVNYLGAIAINKYENRRKTAVTVTILLSVALLAVMKYAYLLESSIILPVGLSFFTFQALSYSIDVYRRKIAVERDFIKVSLYISFLPTILSGPIERARNLFPQLSHVTPMNYDNVIIGVKLFIFGLFKKVVIADRLALYVDQVYAMPEANTGGTLALAAFLYSIQIYCDFSGYADMAIGVGRMLGFTIMDNFKFPYFATSIKEFWRRWHISLTSWFSEYVYISLGGNRVTKLRWIFNIMAIFLLSGVWHGATMAFIIWGGIHGVAYLIEYFLKFKKNNFIYCVVCFVVVSIAWVYFRVEDSSIATTIIYRIFTELVTPVNTMVGGSTFSFVITIGLLLIFIAREIISYHSSATIKTVTNIECIFLLICVALFGVSTSQFVYFQF